MTTRRTRVGLSVEEMQRIIAESREMRLGAGVTLALTTGMRRGEVLGLKWADIDLSDDAAKLRVRRSLQRVEGQLRTDDPKSSKSRRTITLPQVASEALRVHRVRQAEERLVAGEAWVDLDFVFATHKGGPVEPRNFHRDWHRLLERLGYEKRPLHEARHAAASLMLSAGAPLKAVQETLGHSTIRLTADIYGHLMPEDSDRVAGVVDRALGA